MTVRQYIGARYVPIFADPIEWDSDSSYEPLTVVMNQGASYVSKQNVPVGIQITNETYWIKWADYNAQLEEYIRQVQSYSASIDALNNALPIADFDANDTVKDAIDTVKDAIDVINEKFPIQTANIADSAVTTDKIANDAITVNKLNAMLKRRSNCIVMPEDYGAVGDGVTDDSQAFQDMFDAIPENTVVLLSQEKTYLVESQIDITQNAINIIALCESEYMPKILFNTSDSYGLHCTGYSLSLKNIHLQGQSASDPITLLCFDRDNTAAAGHIDSYVENCAFGYAVKAIDIQGKNVKIIDNLFSQINGNCIQVKQLQDTSDTDIRGIVVSRNRFHDVWVVVRATVSSYAKEGCSIVISNNYMDGGRMFYQGITDNVMIEGNYISRIDVQATNVITFDNTIKSDTSCSVIGNHVNSSQSFTGLYPRTFLNATDATSGYFNVCNNTCITKSAQSGAIVWFAGTLKRFVNFVGNVFVNLQQQSNFQINGANQYGIVSNNIINGSFLLANTITASNNVDIHSNL